MDKPTPMAELGVGCLIKNKNQLLVVYNKKGKDFYLCDEKRIALEHPHTIEELTKDGYGIIGVMHERIIGKVMPCPTRTKVTLVENRKEAFGEEHVLVPEVTVTFDCSNHETKDLLGAWVWGVKPPGYDAMETELIKRKINVNSLADDIDGLIDKVAKKGKHK